MTGQLKHVFFRPSVGKHCGGPAFGVPVMILGESHYSEEEPDRDLTRKVVLQTIRGECDFAFFRNSATAFLGDHGDPRMPRFWESVIFYNYVQCLVDKEKRPTRKMWVDAELPFLEVLAMVEPSPRLVVVLGRDTWENTPCCGRDVRSIRSEGEEIPCYEFCIRGRAVLAPKLPHASRGFSPSRWRPVILEALKRVAGHEFR